MIEISITADDLLAGRVLTTGWYRWRIDSITVEAKKAPKIGDNAVLKASCLTANDDSGPVAGVEVTAWLSLHTKEGKPTAAWTLPVLEACGIDVKAVSARGEKINLEALKDHEIDARVEPSEFNGRITNKITAYAVAGKYTSR